MTDVLTLEKLKINERLTSIETIINAYLELRKEEKLAQQETFIRLEKQLDKIEKHQEKIDHIIIGNGTLGVIGRLSKLEDESSRSKDNGKIAKTALIGIILKFIWDFFTHAAK